MYCPYCGAELPDNAVFCKNCGQKLPIIENTESSNTDGPSSNEGTGTFIPEADERILLSTSGVNINDVQVGLHLTNKRFVIYSDTGILGEFALTSIVRYNRIENEAGMSMVLASAKGETEMHVIFSSLNDCDAWVNVLDSWFNQRTQPSASVPRTQEQYHSQSTNRPIPKQLSPGKVAAIIVCIAVVLGVCIGVACIIAASSQMSGVTPSAPQTPSTSQTGNLVLITFTSNPSDAMVSIDGKVYGTTPLKLWLYPSTSYNVRVEKSGYNVWTTQARTGTNATTINATLTKSGSVSPTKSPTKVPTVVPTKVPTPLPTQVQDPDKKKAAAIANAIEPRNQVVRDLALSAIKKSSSGPYNVDQVCDIYDYLYKNWTYVNDPRGEDYYAPASESAALLKGDCDDFAILMASCVEAIGGTARVICARNANNEGHAYAEVYINSDDEEYARGIALDVSNRYNGVYVNWHKSFDNSETSYWLNLDWSAHHPGGQFFTNVGTILIVYSDGYYKRENLTVNGGY